MFRYVFAFLLLNSSYRSSGVPIPSSQPMSLAKLLTTLSTSCENRFLANQIKGKLVYCSDILSPHGEKQLECLLFYDINKQLCEAVGASKLLLNEDYTDKINEEQDVNILCATTKDWVISNIPEYTRYKNLVEKVLKHPVTCGKVCGVEELISDDSNFYCKYFKWGTDMLKTHVVSLPQENPAQLPSGTGVADNKSAGPVSNDLEDVQIKNSTAPSEVVSVKTEGSTKAEVKLEASSETNKEAAQLSADSASEKPEQKTDKAEEPAAVLDQADKPKRPAEINLDLKEIPKPNLLPDVTLAKPESQISPKYEVDKEIQLLNNELEHKEPVIETPGQSIDKLPSDTDVYQDSDEGKDGLGDIQGDDDGEDAMMGDIDKVNRPNDQKEETKESQKIKNIVSGITGETALYPSFGQDNYNDDDEDHFLSFFLTAVIMVILIYVLYHNKNKVGKVFFGLILEGRQSGRRRNSRGHSYRRLDTLEQAMNTNTTAPPSKLIY